MSDGPTPPPGRLSVSVDRGDAEVRLTLEGELDLASVGELEERLAAALADAPGRVVVDLRRLAFIDSSGLRTIIQGDATARAEGIELVLYPGGDSIQRVFALTGTNEVLRFEPASA